MGRSAQSGSMRRWSAAVHGWPVWELPDWLVAYVLTVIAADGAAIVAALALTSVRGRGVVLFGVLLACDVVTVELIRRSGEPGGGLIKETHAVWELPIALLLPPGYGLVAPIVRVAVTQWRVRRALAYRRIFTAAAVGLSYAAASVAFHSAASPLAVFLSAPPSRVEIWVLLALACGALKSVLNKILVMIPIKGSDPEVSVRAQLVTRRALFDDLAELSVGVMVALVVTASPFLALLALPCVTLLQRSQRHYQLMSEARIDGRTGLLNAASWQREAAVRVTRATRTRAWPARSTRAARPRPPGRLPPWLRRLRDARWVARWVRSAAAEDGDSAMVALLMVDIDRFADVNNALGHQAGNVVLEEVAAAIREQLREADLSGRYGGDEFAILLPGASPAEATRIAHRICLAVAELTFPLLDDVTELPAPRVTVSVGVASLDGTAIDLDSLVRAADGAVYAAKDAGRNTVRMVAI